MTGAIFHTAKDEFGSAAGENPEQWIVFRVTDIKTPSIDPDSADAKKNDQALQHQMSDDVIGQYVVWLENDLGTTVNASVLAQTMGGSSSNGAPDTN
jgi:peptidyl-prolyl cis-trans isomerase D